MKPMAASASTSVMKPFVGVLTPLCSGCASK
jgi:hypothetical protein